MDGGKIALDGPKDAVIAKLNEQAKAQLAKQQAALESQKPDTAGNPGGGE
jgi:hypothetical protein